jgi:hypothetical protein
LGRAKEVNKKLLQSERFVRPFFSRKTFFKKSQLFFKNPLTKRILSCIIYPVIQRQQVSVKACRSPAEEDVNLTHRVYYVLSSRRALALTEKVFFFSLVFSVHDWEVKPNAQQFYSGTEEADRR